MRWIRRGPAIAGEEPGPDPPPGLRFIDLPPPTRNKQFTIRHQYLEIHDLHQEGPYSFKSTQTLSGCVYKGFIAMMHASLEGN